MTKSEATRARILAAAVEEIAEHGLGGARTRSIAERAGVNNALLHYHFRTREDLLVEAATTSFAAMAESADAPLQSDSVADGLDAMSEVVGSIDPSEAGWQVIMEVMIHARRIPRLGEFTLAFLEQYRAVLEERLDRAVDDGRLPAGTDTSGLALGLMAMLDGLGLYGYVDPRLDVARAGRAVAAVFRHFEGGNPS
jgi:AcrR family transcriptional regulator